MTIKSVVDKRPRNAVWFSSLKVGDAFEYNGGLYLKCEGPEGEFFAITLKSSASPHPARVGEDAGFCGTHHVTPVNITITIED